MGRRFAAVCRRSPRPPRGTAAWFLFTAGLILSPLTPWNDAVVNLPLSVLLAVPLVRWTGMHPAAAVALAYVATNVLGLVLMGLGALLWRRPKTRRESHPSPGEAADGTLEGPTLEPGAPPGAEPREPERRAA
jgi:hypothetical protein